MGASLRSISQAFGKIPSPKSFLDGSHIWLATRIEHNQDARVADSSGHSLLLVGIAQGPLDIALALYYIVDREMRMPEDVKFRPQLPDLTLQRKRAGDLCQRGIHQEALLGEKLLSGQIMRKGYDNSIAVTALVLLHGFDRFQQWLVHFCEDFANRRRGPIFSKFEVALPTDNFVYQQLWPLEEPKVHPTDHRFLLRWAPI
mmetsp:Transcript_57408/g.134560  ORF Transcript_57408/g.134560 Transcript_57408/m.134560 type:complete len:201 (+) Transcript_57408:50-652(+)